jgi:hypothetical protein
MAGKGVRVLVTPTSDLGKILACMHGESFFLSFFHHLFIFSLSIFEVQDLFNCYV